MVESSDGKWSFITFVNRRRAHKIRCSALTIRALLVGHAAPSSTASTSSNQSPLTPTPSSLLPSRLVSLKQLKKELKKPEKANRILADLKIISSSAAPHPSEECVTECRCVHLPVFSSTVVNVSESISVKVDDIAARFSQLAFPPPALANSPENGLVAPLDRMAIFIYYWGYELTIPHSQMAQLANVHSVSSTLLSFFQAFVVYSGAPELAPFIRYLSSYIDLEFKGIELQDKGHGVVLAATWILPIVIVPRPL